MRRKVVVVTGGSLGVGRAAAAAFARRGYDVTDSLRCELIHDRSSVRVSVVHPPAMNTPQFQQVRSKLPHEPQPVPPIYQPEIAARAIVRAAEHPRCEYWIGLPTVGAIMGQRIAPGLLDRYLGRTGFTSQQTREPAEPDRPDNLHEPFPGDLGTHGRFDDRAHARSQQAWASAHRRALSVAAATLGVAALVGRSSR